MLSAAMRASGFGTRVPDAKPRRRAAVHARVGAFWSFHRARHEHLPPAKEGSIDADVLESVQIAGERIFSEHDHVRDLADLQRSVSILVPGQAVAALAPPSAAPPLGSADCLRSSLTIVVQRAIASHAVHSIE